jgi:hypothetical protein
MTQFNKEAVGLAKELKRWCGPAAVASAMGWGRRRAARRILAARAKLGDPLDKYGRRSGISTITELAVAVGRTPFQVKCYAKRGWHKKDTCPTVAQWLKGNPHREGILRATSHFIHVKHGKVVEDNGILPRRGRVTHVLYLDD